MSVFFLVASLILWLMQVAVGSWLYIAFPRLGWKMPVLLAPILLTAFVRLAMVYTRTHYGTLESWLYYLAYAWAGLVFIAFFIVAGFSLVYKICMLCHIQAKPVLAPLSAVVLLLAAAMALYGGLQEPKIKHINVVIPGAPDMTAAVISDSHLGTGVSLARFERALARLKAENPDALFVLGDLFEYGMHRAKYAQALADVKTPLGSYGVLGNHEYYMGYENSVNFYKSAGLTLLQNKYQTLPNGVQVIGLNDIQTDKVSPERLSRLLVQTDPAKPRILLSHQPLLTATAAEHAISLMLSGHTHNGQLFPFNLFVKMKYPYVYGLHRMGEQSQIYVTSGMFYWGIPLRFLAPSEIPILHIKGHD